MQELTRPIAIYHEHPDWFRPVFAELDRRGVPYVALDAAAHRFDVSSTGDAEAYALVFNRMSPSAHMRGHGQGIFHTLGYLAHLERLGVRVINGTRAYGLEISKAQQLALLRTLGLPFPRTRVINHASQAVAAAEGLRYPIVIKANVGGSGAGIVRYDSPGAVMRAVEAGAVDLGIDATALVQEYIPARGGHITRVEVLDGRFLYAINVYAAGDSFNLCPADICQTSDGVALARSACAVDAPKNNIRVEAAAVSPAVIADVEQIMRAAGIEIGGVEFLVDERDGQRYYYDVNALSNFVADAPRVVGFDPFARLVDWLDHEAQAAMGPADLERAIAV